MDTNTMSSNTRITNTCVRTNTNTHDSPILSLENVIDVMKDLEEKVNPRSVSEGLSELSAAVTANDASILLDPMKNGADEFERRVGRPMTYGEMRSMWG
jgi:hypothetical protein